MMRLFSSLRTSAYPGGRDIVLSIEGGVFETIFGQATMQRATNGSQQSTTGGDINTVESRRVLKDALTATTRMYGISGNSLFSGYCRQLCVKCLGSRACETGRMSRMGGHTLPDSHDYKQEAGL